MQLFQEHPVLTICLVLFMSSFFPTAKWGKTAKAGSISILLALVCIAAVGRLLDFEVGFFGILGAVLSFHLGQHIARCMWYPETFEN